MDEQPPVNEPTRRRLSDEEIEAIKDQLLESIYADIGKSIVKKFLWVTGSLVAALVVITQHKDKVIALLK